LAGFQKRTLHLLVEIRDLLKSGPAAPTAASSIARQDDFNKLDNSEDVTLLVIEDKQAWTSIRVVM
jgi:hypothetical protein